MEHRGGRSHALTLPGVARNAQRAAADDAPPLDPDAVQDAYRLHRARRMARIEQRRRSKRAGIRFWLVLAVLLALSVALGVTIWREVQQLFGL